MWYWLAAGGAAAGAVAVCGRNQLRAVLSVLGVHLRLSAAPGRHGGFAAGVHAQPLWSDLGFAIGVSFRADSVYPHCGT